MMFFISTFFILAPLTAQDSNTPVFKAGVSDVRVDVQVTEGKNLVKGLSKDDFVVTDENEPQAVVSFSHGEERLNIILLLDISGSMQKYIEEIAQTARETLEHLRPGDRVAIMVFARTSAVHQGFSDNLAETARQIASAVKVDVGSRTLLNSAVIGAAHYIEAHG
jgi:VWFA-related protein